MPIIVSFQQPDEFQAEITRDVAQVERGILRATMEKRGSDVLPLQRVYVVAGAVVEGRLIQLRHFCGEAMKKTDRDFDRPTWDRVDQVTEELQRFAKGLNLDFRAGMYEDARS